MLLKSRASFVSFLFLLFLLFETMPLKAQNFIWAKRAGDIYSDFAIAIEADAAGNSYVTGQIRGTVGIGTHW